MTKEELKQILDEHKKWLETDGEDGFRANLCYANLRNADLRNADLRNANLRYANLRDADLCYADLRYADLCRADLDYSCFPLWCGGLDVHIDDRQATQLLYHLVRNVQFSENTSEDFKKLLSNVDIVTQANKFHRVEECGRIETEKNNAAHMDNI